MLHESPRYWSDNPFHRKADQFQRFLDEFVALYLHQLHIILLDNARSLTLPPNIQLLFLPPYTLELNPIEWLWLVIKNLLAWQNFDPLAALDSALHQVVTTLDALSIRSLMAFPFLMEVISALDAHLSLPLSDHNQL